jgi:hypothetical protein
MESPEKEEAEKHVVLNEICDKNIRNFSYEDFKSVFQTEKLDVSTIWLITSGFDDVGIKRYAYIILRACQIRPFFGPHLVSVMYQTNATSKMETFWVHSLTFLRRNIFKFTDRLSFERSSYLIPYDDGDLLIRIKSIRAFLTLPTVAWNEKPHRFQTKTNERKTLKEATDKTKHLIHTAVQSVVTYVTRENNVSTEESILQVKEYVATYLDSLITKKE